MHIYGTNTAQIRHILTHGFLIRLGGIIYADEMFSRQFIAHSQAVKTAGFDPVITGSNPVALITRGFSIYAGMVFTFPFFSSSLSAGSFGAARNEETEIFLIWGFGYDE